MRPSNPDMSSTPLTLTGSCMALNFLLCAILSSGFEWGAELSFPSPESTIAGVMNSMAQFGGWPPLRSCSSPQLTSVCHKPTVPILTGRAAGGIALIHSLETIIASWGFVVGNAVQAGTLLLASLCFVMVSGDLRRQASMACRLDVAPTAAPQFTPQPQSSTR